MVRNKLSTLEILRLQDKLKRRESLTEPEQRWLAFEVAQEALKS